LPKFRSHKEAAEYFESHSVADAWDICRLRRRLTKLSAARKVAATKSVAYQTQLRMWIAEGIRREA